MTQADVLLPADIWAPSKARDLVLGIMADHAGSEELHKALLAVSEVVTNVIGHGVDDDPGTITLRIERSEDLVTVRVLQSRQVPERPSIVDVPEGWSNTGYGLEILDAVADRWGIGLDPPSVWFELRL